MPTSIQSLAKALDGEADKVELMEKAKSISLLNSSNELLINVAEEKDAAEVWGKLDAIYPMKVLNIHLYIPKWMFQF